MEHKTNVEILENQKHGFNLGQKASALNAMDEYSKQECISFCNWIAIHTMDYQTTNDGRWIGLDLVKISTEELYNLYLQSKL